MLQKVTEPAIKIEKGVPLPPKAKGGGRTRKWPLDKMEVGDCFLAAGKKQPSMSSIISGFRKQYPDRRFATRQIDGGVRVWRIA